MKSIKSVFEVSVINAVSDFPNLNLQFIEVKSVKSVVTGIERCVLKNKRSELQLFITFQPLDIDGIRINELFYTIVMRSHKTVELNKLLEKLGLSEDDQRCSKIDFWSNESFAKNMVSALKHGLMMLSKHALAYLEDKEHSNEFSYDFDSATEKWLYEEQRKRLGLNNDTMGE